MFFLSFLYNVSVIKLKEAGSLITDGMHKMMQSVTSILSREVQQVALLYCFVT
jgi:hypothetical protein